MSAISTLSDGSLVASATDITLTPDRNLQLNGTQIHIGDIDTDDVIVNPGGTFFARFTANDPTDWSGPPPQWMSDAINRIAYALARAGWKP